MAVSTPTGASAPRNRFYNEVFIALLALGISVVSLVWTTIVYFWEEDDEKIERSIKEVDRIYDPEFSVSLSKVLNHAYDFLENPNTNKLRGKERFEKFWTGIDADSDMLVIYSRLASIEDCVYRNDCFREQVLSRFPDAMYQALFFLR